MMLGTKRILAGGVEPIHLLLQLRVRLRMREETVEHARERARGRIGAGNNREHAVIVELARGRGRLVRQIFVVLERYPISARQRKEGSEREAGILTR